MKQYTYREANRRSAWVISASVLLALALIMSPFISNHPEAQAVRLTPRIYLEVEVRELGEVTQSYDAIRVEPWGSGIRLWTVQYGIPVIILGGQITITEIGHVVKYEADKVKRGPNP